MAASQPSKSFFDDIKSQLECLICTDQLKNPKLLPCLHTFCEMCVEQYVKIKGNPFPCPACRVPVHVPSEGVGRFQSNFFVNNLLDTVVMHGTVKQSCVICEESGNADFMCIECKVYMCGNCKLSHSKHTRSHKIISSKDLNNKHVQRELRSKQQVNCTTHREEPVRFYCVPCKVPICRDCTIMKHHGHKCEELNEAARRAKVALNEQLTKLNKTRGEIVLHQELVENTKKGFNRHMHDAQTEMTKWHKRSRTKLENDRKRHEKDLDIDYDKKLKKLNEWYGQGKDDLKQRFTENERELDQKQHVIAGDLGATALREKKQFDAADDQLSLQLGTLQRTLDMTDKIIKHGKSAEILLHECQLLERMTELLTEDVLPPQLTTCYLDFEGDVNTIRKTKLKKSVDANTLEQDARRNSIRVYGIEEVGDGQQEDCELLIQEFAKTNLNVTLNLDQMVDSCYRIGRKKRYPASVRPATKQNKKDDNSSPRVIVVKFTSYKFRKAIMDKKKLLKQSQYFIWEDLTAENYALLRKAKQHPKIKSAWSVDGRITVLLKDSEKKKVIQSVDDIYKADD